MTNIHELTYVESKKVKQKRRVAWWLPGFGGWGGGEKC